MLGVSFIRRSGHPITNCLALDHQLDELVKSGFLNDYLVGSSGAATLAAPAEDQAHEMPIHGEVHTISGGFSGEGCIASQRKRYVRSINSVEEQGVDDSLDIELAFTNADLHDVVPYNNDPVVISVVTTRRRVHQVLVDQGNSADVMFWSMFNKLQLSLDLLRPYTGCLYGFVGDQVEVHDYLELRTTLTDGTASHTENIRYLEVNANSAYNILLGRPALNRLRWVSSTRHMKLKLPDLSGRVIVLKSDQKEAKKCYENSLKTKRGVLMVVERPPMEETPMEVEPMEETPAEALPTKEAPEEALPVEEAPTEAVPGREGREVVSRAENARERRPEPAENVVERQIGGKTFKLGKSLDQAEQDLVAGVIAQHLDAFAWSSSDMPGIDPDFLCLRLTMDPKV